MSGFADRCLGCSANRTFECKMQIVKCRMKGPNPALRTNCVYEKIWLPLPALPRAPSPYQDAALLNELSGSSKSRASIRTCAELPSLRNWPIALYGLEAGREQTKFVRCTKSWCKRLFLPQRPFPCQRNALLLSYACKIGAGTEPAHSDFGHGKAA